MSRIIMFLLLSLFGLIGCQTIPTTTAAPALPPLTMPTAILKPTTVPQPIPPTPAPTATAAVVDTAVIANQTLWSTYRDPDTGLGLAIPSQWVRYEPTQSLTQSPLTLLNYQPPPASSEACHWPHAILKLEIWAIPISSEQTTTAWADERYGAEFTHQPVSAGRHSGLLLTKPSQTSTTPQNVVVRLTPTTVILFNLLSGSSWTMPDLQALLASVAGPTGNITIPAAPPTPPIVSTNFCQEYVNIRSGPSTETDILGQLHPTDSYPIIGRSADQKWVQIQYQTEEAWVFAPLTIISVGDIPQTSS